MKKEWYHEYNPKTGSFEKVSKKKSKKDGEYDPETGSFERESKIEKVKKTAFKPLRKKKPKIKVKKNLKKKAAKKKIKGTNAKGKIYVVCSNPNCSARQTVKLIQKSKLKGKVCGNCSSDYEKLPSKEGRYYHQSFLEDKKSNQIWLFGQMYNFDEYNKWLYGTKQIMRENCKNTEYEDYPFDFTTKTKGKFWNSDRIYPKSRNQFIAKFFKNREPKGLEGLWNMERWGLIGVVKEGSYYQVYNINVVLPRPEAQKGAVESFFDGMLGEESPKEINYGLVNGTKDCAWIPTSKKNKFRWEGRGVYLIPTSDNYHIFANEEFKMDINVINNNVVTFTPEWGNEQPAKAQRDWPEITQEDEITSKGGVKTAMSGTGFFVDNKGHIITNYHVVAPCDNKQKIIYNNKELSAKLIHKDKQLDLALLKVNVNNKYFIKITNKPIRKLQPIIAAGYPGGKALSDDLKFTSGIISSLKGIDDNSSQIQIDAALNLGNSGGPIVDNRSGELVGVAVSILRNEIVEGINFGIKVSQVRDFLYANKIDTKKISKKYKGKNLNTILENSTLYVFCN